MRKRAPLAVVTAAVTLASLVGYVASASASSASKASASPIVVGSVNALSGPATFPEASQAAAAVFNQINAQGGIHGHKIKYTALDDKGSAQTAAADAHELVQGDNAVALVGSASLLDCAVNGAYYAQQKILSIQGTGVDQVCFSNPNISPVNVGPFKDSTLTLDYGSKVLHLKKICAFLEIAGGTEPSYKKAFAAWTKDTGGHFVFLDDKVPYGAANYTPYVVKAKAAGCNALYTNATEPDAIGTIKAAQAQGWNPTFLMLTSVYSSQFAKAVGSTGAKVYVPAEFAPYDSPSNPATKTWRAFMKKHHIALTSFGQGGYIAAENFVKIVNGIKGPITRASVTKAIRAHAPISSPMQANPWVFGKGSSHSSINGGWPIKLTRSGSWTEAAKTWERLG